MSAPDDLFDFSVAEAHHDVGERRCFGAVCGHQSCDFQFARETHQKIEDDVAGHGVEIPCRLIRKKNGGRLDESAGDANALHLPAGELVGKTVAQSIEFDPSELFAGSGTRIGLSGEKQRQLDIFKNSERVQKLKRLENETDFFAAEPCEAGVVQSGRLDAVEEYPAGGGEIHRAGEIEQSGFAAAAAPDESYKVSTVYVQRNIV